MATTLAELLEEQRAIVRGLLLQAAEKLAEEHGQGQGLVYMGESVCGERTYISPYALVERYMGNAEENAEETLRENGNGYSESELCGWLCAYWEGSSKEFLAEMLAEHVQDAQLGGY